MGKIKNLSLKLTIILYVTIVLGISSILSLMLVKGAEKIQEEIWFKYVDREEYNKSVENESGSNYLTQIPRINPEFMSKRDAIIVEICDAVETWSDLFVSLSGCVVAVFLFYRNKIKIPLQELSYASKKISENDLNFEVRYETTDEMGLLCEEFEKMRQELCANKKRMWNMIEDEKILRAAIAHDIRTPIAIIEGNLEILQEFFPQNRLSEEKTIQLIDGSLNHVIRLKHFINAMRQLNSIIDIEPAYEEIGYLELVDKMKDIEESLCRGKNIKYRFQNNGGQQMIKVDEMLIQEVEENLLANALRYAIAEINVTVEIKDEFLSLKVEDDGEGFADSPQKLVQAYYKNQQDDGGIHYGLGLYISKVLCDKHGGNLILGNKEQGGAVATAIFNYNTTLG